MPRMTQRSVCALLLSLLAAACCCATAVSGVAWSAASPPVTASIPTYYETYYNSVCVIDASNRNINSLVKADVTKFWQTGQPCAGTSLSYFVIDLSGNAFTAANIAPLFTGANAVFVPATFTLSSSAKPFRVILSHNKLGPVLPSVFNQTFATWGLVLQNCSITSIPAYAFEGVNQPDSTARIQWLLDLSGNDLRNGLVNGSFGSATGYGLWGDYRTWPLLIVLQNANLRSSSLPLGLMYSQHAQYTTFKLDMSNAPLDAATLRSMTPAQYLATQPNFFVDFPSGLFNNVDNVMPGAADVILGDFVNSVGVIGEKVKTYVDYVAGDWKLIFAPPVALAAMGVRSEDFCPLVSFMRAFTARGSQQAIFDDVNVHAIGFDLPLPDAVSRTGRCAPMDCSAGNPSGECVFFPAHRVYLPIEPLFLTNEIIFALNAAGFNYDQRLRDGGMMVAWNPPVDNNAYNPALNRSDWLPTDLLCNLHVTVLVMPILPVGWAAPPAGVLRCLQTTSLHELEWRTPEWSQGLLDGLSVSQVAVGLNLYMLVDQLYGYTEAAATDGDYSTIVFPIGPPPDFFTAIQNQAKIFVTCGWADYPGPDRCFAYYIPGDQTKLCPAGKGVNDVCYTCPSGFYSDAYTSILSPDTPSFSTYELPFCKACPRGSFCDPAISTQPQPCAPGTIAPITGLTKCATCPAGTFNPSQGGSGFGDCVQCAPGTARALRGGTQESDCIPCAAGTAAFAPGIANCPQCAPGSWQNNTGAFECQPCPANTYREQAGATAISQCIKCPDQLPFSPAGSTSLLSCSGGVVCAPGNFTASGAAAPCLNPCPVGSFCQGGAPRACPAGSYADKPGQANCTPCGAGLYGAQDGSKLASDCFLCPLSTFSAAPVTSYCETCPKSFTTMGAGSQSRASCVAVAGCDPSATLCPVGSSVPIQLSSLLPGSQSQLNRFLANQNSTITSAAMSAADVTRVYRSYTAARSAPSLRMAAFGSDEVLSDASAIGASSEANVIHSGNSPSSLSTPAVISLLVILLLVAFASWPLYTYLPAAAAWRLDQFSAAHSTAVGKPPIRVPTQFGLAVTWTFLWVGILVAIFLSTASNTVTNTSLVPPSSLGEANVAMTNMQITLRAYSSEGSVSSHCQDPATVVGTQEGFSHLATAKLKPTGQTCSVAADCLGCGLSGGVSSLVFQFPFDTQLIEWEVWASSAAPGTWNRRSGVLTQLPGQLLDAEADLTFSAIEAYFVDKTRNGDGQTKSGFEVDFLQYVSRVPQSPSTYNGQSTVQLRFAFTKSDILFDSSKFNKLNGFQIVVSIVTAIVSLFSIFSIVFRKTEHLVLQGFLKRSSGEVGEIEGGDKVIRDKHAELALAGPDVLRAQNSPAAKALAPPTGLVSNPVVYGSPAPAAAPGLLPDFLLEADELDDSHPPPPPPLHYPASPSHVEEHEMTSMGRRESTQL